MINIIDRKGNKVNIPDSKTAQQAFDLSLYGLYEDGEELCKNLKPLFQGLTLEDYVQDYPYIEAMSATEYTGEKLKMYKSSNKIVAEEKLDGHRAIMHIGTANRLFSKRISKESNWFTENTDTVPHLRSLKVKKEFHKSIVDGEFTSDIEGADSNTIQTVTGSLPVRALKQQLEVTGLLIFNVFDILHYKGIDVTALPMIYRKLFAFKVFKEFNSPYVRFVTLHVLPKDFSLIEREVNDNAYMLTDDEREEFLRDYVCIVEDFDDLFTNLLSMGKEGIMLKKLYSPYEFKKTDSFVKMKETRIFDVIILRAGDTRRDYTGKSRVWNYFEDSKGRKVNSVMNIVQAKQLGYVPVSKPYYKGWVQTLVCGVYDRKGKVVEIAEVSSFTDAMAEYITEHIEELINEPIEIKGQRVMDKGKGSIRHPRFHKLRPDQEPKNCTLAKVLE